jgi:hypothetical protein
MLRVSLSGTMSTGITVAPRASKCLTIALPMPIAELVLAGRSLTPRSTSDYANLLLQRHGVKMTVQDALVPPSTTRHRRHHLGITPKRSLALVFFQPLYATSVSSLDVSILVRSVLSGCGQHIMNGYTGVLNYRLIQSKYGQWPVPTRRSVLQQHLRTMHS